MKKNNKSHRTARKSDKPHKRKQSRKRDHMRRTAQPDAMFNGVKSKDELDQIKADLQQSGRKFLVSLITIVATKNWEELGYKNAKSFLKASVPHIKYHTAMSWFRSNEIIARLAGPEFIGVYSMNAMRVFAPLKIEQQEALWEAVTKEWEQETKTEEPIDTVWLTRAKVLEVKSILFPPTEKQCTALNNVLGANVVASQQPVEEEVDLEQEGDYSDLHDFRKSSKAKNDEEGSENEVETEQDDDAFDINKPKMSEKRQRRIQDLKRHIEQYDGSGVFAVYIISWMVREYHESQPTLDKLIAREVQAQLHQLKEQKHKAQGVDNEA